MRLTSITTKTGDRGSTGLGDGSRRAKHDARIEAYGTIDEANSAIGWARALMAEAGEEAIGAHLARIQNDLFDVGADLCVPDNGKPRLRIDESYTTRLEEESAQLNADLPPLDSFILPAGRPMIAALHLARTITRRAERRITALQEKEKINPETLRYINRLSDLLFIMARYLSRGEETKWVPQKNP